MGLCRDRFTNYLADHGYNIIRVPQEGIRPLDLIGDDRTQLRLGRIEQLLTSPPKEAPVPIETAQAADIRGQRSSRLNASIGVNILNGVLAALAGAQIEMTAAYASAKTVTFTFEDVLTDAVAPLEVGQYLRGTQIDAMNPVLARYVLGYGRLFLITQTLKARSITVSAETNGGSTLELNVPLLEKAAGGKLKIGDNKAAAGGVVYEGERYLVFGFKCYQVGIEDGDLALSAASPEDVALADYPVPLATRESIIAPGELLTFRAEPL